jgi:fructose-bisphosphate aldolase class II
VPQEWLAVINQYGGEINETYGVPVEQIQEGIRNGVRKVNIDTDLRLASTGAVRKFLAENKSEFDPRKFLAPTIPAMKGIVKERLQAFGTAGQISTIGKIYSLEEMATRYPKGHYKAVVN